MNSESDFKIVSQYIRPYIRPYIKQVILGSICILFSSMLILPAPFITKYIIDSTINGKNIKQLLTYAIILLICMTISSVIGYCQSMLFCNINNKIVMNMRIDILHKIYKIPLNESEKFGDGYLISRINEDTTRLKSMFVDTIISSFKDVFTLIIGIIAIFNIDIKLSIIICIVLPIYVIVSIYFSNVIRKLSIKYYESDGQATQVLNESLKIKALAKMFLQYKYSMDAYRTKLSLAVQANIKLYQAVFLNGSIVGVIAQLMPIITIIYAGIEIINNKMTIGSLVAFNSCLIYLLGPISRLINFNSQIQQSLAALKRINELLNIVEEKIDYGFTIPDDINTISFRNVYFKYNNDSNLILNNINFNANKGQIMGIVGPSGSGKTTLLKVLLGIYPIIGGDIKLNNYVLATEQLIALRKKISIVTQETLVLNDTIYNNILFGNSNVSSEEVFRAAKLSHSDEFINKLKEKYNTLIGKDGIDLSMGQKQRIALCRALIRKPKILLLDEVTSNIDSISEKCIVEAINTMKREVIIIIISHNLNIIKQCDKIVVINDGIIQQIGDHFSLMNNNNLYKELNIQYSNAKTFSKGYEVNI